MNVFKKRTIARDLTLGLALTITGVTVSISSLNYFFSVAGTEQRLEKQATDTVDKLSAVSALPLWNVDTKVIELVAEAYQQTENVVGLRVLDESGRAIYESAAPQGEAVVHATAPIDYSGQRIGLVEVSLTRSNIQAAQQKTLYLTLLIMLCVILSVVLVTHFLLKMFLSKPLEKLTQGIETIASGAYDHLLPPVKQGDINAINQEVNLMARQIGERDKALRESKERYEELANLLPETVYETDEKGYFTFLNRGGFECFGLSQEDLDKGLSISQLFAPEHWERFEDNTKRVLAGERLGAFECLLKRKDGSRFPVIVHASPVVRGHKTVGLRAIAVDITDRKRIEEALEKLAAGVAHQVRNPIMTIGGFALRLQKRFAPDERPQNWLKIILREVERLERMVRDIHQHTSLPQPELRATPLPAVVEGVLSELLTEIDSQDIRIERRFLGDIPEVLADADLLGLALGNIFKNAKEAMPAGGDLEITIAPEGDRVCIFVKDTGVGIAPQDLPSVFDPFFSSKPQSSGLGLTTVHRIISDQKGEIKINSTPGGGTAVRLCFSPVRAGVEFS